MHKIFPPITLAGYLLTLLLSAAAALAQEPDWQAYAQVLQRHVRPVVLDGIALNGVDYAALRKDPLYAKVRAGLAHFDPAHLAGHEERLAFYINAYNILAIKVVTDNWPLDSIKDVGGLFTPVWKQTAGVIGGRRFTLDEIEHEVLRPMGDPRIHMAIVCASVSCPDLRTEPYRGARLQQQLDQQAADFLTNPGKGLRITESGIRVSKIFDWFKEDFAKAYGGVRPFLNRYRAGLPAKLALAADLPYNWSLNDSGRAP
ncbi:MAG: DUF547 domain-containing protein [Gammaproteobacteria bacterium]